MAYRLPSERVSVTIEDGPTVEVERIGVELVFSAAVGLSSAFTAKRDTNHLRPLYRYFLAEAQPTWEILDHKGPVYPTVDGMLRMPLDLALGIVSGWLGTFIEQTTAVDEMIPAGPARDELNRRLKQARKRKAA